VIKLCAQPGVEKMALLAIAGSKSRTRTWVIWIGGVLPIFEMAGIALRAKAEELSNGGALVAGIARHSGVRSEEWEAIVVVLDVPGGDIPALYGVALRAIRAHLAAVNVCVAIGAVFPYIGKDGFGVALHALHFFVHAAKGVLGFVVIEFGDRANRPPTGGGMAIFAWNGERSVRAARGLFLRVGRRSSGGGGSRDRTHRREQECEQGPEHEMADLERRQLPDL